MVSRMNPSRATSAERFLPLSAEVAAALGPGPLGHVTETGSTNTDLAAEARAGERGGAVLVADHQTAGRGRLDRSWDDDPAAALLVSLRIPAAHDDANRVVAAVGAAARAAATDLCTVPVLAKWPNDLVVVEGDAPGKLAGVLAEFVAGDPSAVVVGVGINIVPIGRHPGSTSIVACGGPNDRDALLAGLLRHLAERMADPARVIDETRTHSATLHARVRVELPGDTQLLGTATALLDDGRLEVTTDDGVRHAVGAGDVVHLRPA